MSLAFRISRANMKTQQPAECTQDTRIPRLGREATSFIKDLVKRQRASVGGFTPENEREREIGRRTFGPFIIIRLGLCFLNIRLLSTLSVLVVVVLADVLCTVGYTMLDLSAAKGTFCIHIHIHFHIHIQLHSLQVQFSFIVSYCAPKRATSLNCTALAVCIAFLDSNEIWDWVTIQP